MANIKQNLAYSAILTLSTYLVPLIVFPYISRVLGVEGIGQIDTVDNIIDYCILFSMMGLTTVGIREIAKNKDNPQALGQTFTDLFVLNLYSTLFIAIVFGIVVWTSPKLSNYGVLIPIGAAKLIANLFWIEWLYTGLEEFKYITLRSVILRTAFIIAVFIFVNDQHDTTVYYLLFAGITIGNAICNWTYKRTFLHWDIRKANIKHYITPFFVLGLFAMLSAIYTKLSLPVLSFLTDDQEAGNYATATRVYQVIIALVGTLTAVMIPRMSVLMKENRFDKVREYSLMSFKLLFIFSFPIICFMEIFAPDIIRLFAGTGFEGAILPMRIIMPQLIIIGAEKIIVLQLLIPLRKDRTIVMAGLIGVFNWCIFTALLVPTYHNIGTSIVWVIAELTVLLIANRETQRSLNIHFPVKLFLLSCLYAIPYLLLGWGIYYVTEDPVMRIILSMVLFIGYATLLEFKVYKTGILQPVVNIIKRVT